MSGRESVPTLFERIAVAIGVLGYYALLGTCGIVLLYLTVLYWTNPSLTNREFVYEFWEVYVVLGGLLVAFGAVYVGLQRSASAR